VSQRGALSFRDHLGYQFSKIDLLYLSKRQAWPGKFAIRHGLNEICRGVINANTSTPFIITHGSLPGEKKAMVKQFLPEHCRELDIRIYPPDQSRPDLIRRQPTM
jgi:hypothetical protein